MASVVSAVAAHGSPTITPLPSVMADNEPSQPDHNPASSVPLRSQSIDTLSLNRQQSSQSVHSASSRDGGSTKSGRSGVKKLLPGTGKRKQRKMREEELRLATEELARGRSRLVSQTAGSSDSGRSKSLSIDPSDTSDLPLPTESPHGLTSTASERNGRRGTVPALITAPSLDPSPSPKNSASALLASNPSPSGLEKIEPSTADSRPAGTNTKARSRSPSRKFRAVFSKAKTPKGSPERKSVPTFASPLSKSVIALTEEPSEIPPVPALPPASEAPGTAMKLKPALDTRPLTPPTPIIPTPLTTLTPPTPTDSRFEAADQPAYPRTDSSPITVKGDNITVSPSGNMISHRRIRSTSSVVHQHSKLSNSVTASAAQPLQDIRTPSAGSTAAATTRSTSGSFFSTWMTAAQTAASTLTNLTAQNRSRATTSASDPIGKPVESIQEEVVAVPEPEIPRRQLAVETMGSGDLNFDHFRLDSGSIRSLTRPSFTDLRHESLIARDMAAAKAEDALAQKAVSAAYECANDATPVAEITDPLGSLPHETALASLARQNASGNSAIVDAETSSVKRTTSVRSKLATRSSRGSSAAGHAHSAPSTVESVPNFGPTETQDLKAVLRMPSGTNGQSHPSPPTTAIPLEPPSAPGPYQATGHVTQDFPGPATHPPSECVDASTHYEIIIKDEILPAPLGKVYSLLYGAQSSAFVRKFLVDECKSLDLQLEDDKVGLSNEKKTRQYTYIKPLNGSIGPKQTKCITTEEIDFFDLDKAVTVTCSTQTPDVPSGSSFVTKTRYCLTWGPGNSTRLQMNCTVEWSAKSWFKVAIEKGAKDGQQQYGDSLVKALKAKLENWALLEPFKTYLGPIFRLVRSVIKLEYVVAILFIMVLMLWFSKSSSVRGLAPYAGLDSAHRLAAYDEMWRKQETELWDWLEQRAGLDTALLQKRSTSQGGKANTDAARQQKAKQIQRQAVLKGKDMDARLREEKMTQHEMEQALKVTKQRLDVLEDAIRRRKQA
ncbi:hypothetical protein DV738_g5542, partial [Chaetothyriales sp. CBS 135597]